MTPQLQQAIKLLQLSSQELTAYLEEQLERNPLLELAESREPPVDGERAPPDDDWDDGGFADPEMPDTAVAVGNDADIAGKAAELDTDYDNVWDSAAAEGLPSGMDPGGPSLRSGSGGSFEDRDFDLEQVLSERVSLRDHLIGQLQLEIAEPAERLIGLHLIDHLDEAGYMRTDLAEIALDLGCGASDVEAVLLRLQGFDPAGIFARSLGECLALQLRDRNRHDPAIQAVLDNLDLLARRDFAGLMSRAGIDQEDLADIVREIRALNPRPAAGFDSEPVEGLVPDVIMRRTPEGDWSVELNADALPRVLVDASYHAVVRRGARSKDERDFIAEQFHAASWLVKSLHQRATTILKVAGEIVRQQDAFFAYGVQHLRPLTLRDIADAIGMHESTVSRVTTAKYIATPRGLFELKYFFTSSIASANGGDAHSAEAVRYRIRALIDREPSRRVLSDDKIVELLRGEGIDIARRTVAKYREAMRIPSSVQRRREKTAAL
jgi:RNA polymerase sigma-54 factor